ncbi:MAG: hypothetical protein Q7R56_03170 [Nanoarchaeota archaeon]|nr:hypothetical protein [Nanoarchaeota archaeon]
MTLSSQPSYYHNNDQKKPLTLDITNILRERVYERIVQEYDDIFHRAQYYPPPPIVILGCNLHDLERIINHFRHHGITTQHSEFDSTTPLLPLNLSLTERLPIYWTQDYEEELKEAITQADYYFVDLTYYKQQQEHLPKEEKVLA